MAAQGKPAELLISSVSLNDFSYMFHKPNMEFTKMQAQALGIRQVFFTTKGEKEKELADLEAALRENKVTELITGAVASTYQKSRIERLCETLNITPYSPLWEIDPLIELNELATNFNVIITQVAAEGFGRDLLGSRIDSTMIDKLVKLNKKYGINMLFEGGEAESFVLDAPLFTKRIEIIKARTEMSGSVGKYTIEEAKLVEKV
jgi:ABC transporter with metal-binding/Fe-S-binding domain ATP-binding protein